MARVNNKIALITGGAKGIGSATAKLLAQEGAQVIITDIIDDIGKKLAQEIGSNATYYHLDVAIEKDWIKVTEQIRKNHGHIDILFNNAGIIGLDEDFGPQDPEHVSLDSWDHIHKVNLNGVFLGCKYGISLMKKHGGSIINMSSRSGVVGIPAAAAYASSKAAIRNHTKTVALYCTSQGYNIRCNSLHPGAILTPLWDKMLGTDPEKRKQMINSIASGIPMGHMGEPLDVAYAVLYLGSNESKYITGIELTLDGGILAGSSTIPQRSED